jgi:UDP-glucose-4-epimerase GalE
MKTRVLVTGGAGYVGSHCAKLLTNRGYHVQCLDNLSAGHREAVSGELIIGDIRNYELLCDLLSEIDIVMHFAALMQVGESVLKPLEYYDNNVNGTLCILRAMAATGVKRIVVSSTCAVYGIPDVIPITETTPLQPINPYGETKAIMESLLAYAQKVHQIQSISLRYFNAAGAAADGSLGEAHSPETHLIPLAINATSAGPPLTIFGDDFPTPDGTCLRDYVHVDDLAMAHHMAIKRLLDRNSGGIWNLGSGKASSVHDVIAAVEQATGRNVVYNIGNRREGDPPILVANIQKVIAELGWRPSYSLDTIIHHACRWHENPKY